MSAAHKNKIGLNLVMKVPGITCSVTVSWIEDRPIYTF